MFLVGLSASFAPRLTFGMINEALSYKQEIQEDIYYTALVYIYQKIQALVSIFWLSLKI